MKDPQKPNVLVLFTDQHYARDFRDQFPDLLFDRKNDPLETQNLIGQPQYAEIERTLRSHLRDWLDAAPDVGGRQAIDNQ